MSSARHKFPLFTEFIEFTVRDDAEEIFAAIAGDRHQQLRHKAGM